MKKLMYIMPEDENSKEILSNEQGLAYSEEYDSFICYEEVFNELNNKYNFENEDDDGIYVYTSELGDVLECNWYGNKEVVLHSWYGDDEKIEHDLGGDWEIALSPYQDETYPDHEKYVQELFDCKDWYKHIFKQIRITMLTLILDSIKMDVEMQIGNIEKEE
jgi:hypothetical protein